MDTLWSKTANHCNKAVELLSGVSLSQLNGEATAIRVEIATHVDGSREAKVRQNYVSGRFVGRREEEIPRGYVVVDIAGFVEMRDSAKAEMGLDRLQYS